jgi:subtilisin family serine protease
VDLAAPGCQISSWVDADNPAIEISGTSQAAPLVSFSMALLRSMWRASPAQLKNRALYSGDLLESVADRSVVWSKSQLNIEKTLTYLWDRVTYMKDGQSFTKFGQLSAVQGLRCDSGAGIIPANLKAIKRAPNNRVALYTVDSGQILRVCWGRIDPATKATLRVEKEWIDGKILPFEAGPNTPSEIDLDGSQILEVIKTQ